MPLMKFKNVPKESRELAFEEVEIPTFGEVDGEPYSVRVRAMTAHEYSLMTRGGIRFEVRTSGNGDSAASQPVAVVNDDHDEVAFAAGTCSYDGEGNRVFGKTRKEAIETCRNLHSRHRPDLMAIHQKVLELSYIEIGSGLAVERAEKN